MFVEIKYGNDQSFIINAKCQAVHFNEYLLRKLQEGGINLNNDDILDLVNPDQRLIGLLNLRHFPPNAYMSEVVGHRDLYVPVIVKLNAYHNMCDYRLLLMEPEYRRDRRFSITMKINRALEIAKQPEFAMKGEDSPFHALQSKPGKQMRKVQAAVKSTFPGVTPYNHLQGNAHLKTRKKHSG